MSHNLNNAVAVIGIDIGKNSFHVVGLDSRGGLMRAYSGQVETLRRLRHGGDQHVRVEQFTSMRGHRQSSAPYGRLTEGMKPQRECHPRINRSIAIANLLDRRKVFETKSAHHRMGISLRIFGLIP